MSSLLDALFPGDYVFTITGGNYLIDSSGTSKAVKAHQEIFVHSGINFIAAFPVSKTIPFGKPPKVIMTGVYGVIVNGTLYDVQTIPQIVNMLSALQNQRHLCRGILIHHLYRSRIDLICKAVMSLRDVPVVFYLHDYYSFCINPKLLKNDSYFCGGKENCRNCIYGKMQKKHIAQVKKLLYGCKDRLTCVAPAEFTKQIWVKLFPDFAKQVIVIPHLVAKGEVEADNLLEKTNQEIRIAYLGAQTTEKGWQCWKKLVREAPKGYYQFFYFGNGKEKLEDVTNVCVEVANQGKNAMIEALRKYRIQVVLLASIWPETYSYTMYESLAANCWIMTIKESGNIALEVKKENLGNVYEDTNDLYEELKHPGLLFAKVSKWQKNGHAIPREFDDNGKILSLYPPKNEPGNICEMKVSPASEIFAKWIGKTYRSSKKM